VPNTFQRAHHAEQKEIRRQTILAAALERFSEHSLSEITIASIARKAGLSKGSVYSYFATKEEVFLALLRGEIEGWSEVLRAVLTDYETMQPVERVVADLVDTLRPQQTMLRLLSRLFIDIEENLSMEAVLDFKRWMLESTLRTGALLERALGIASLGDVPAGSIGAQYMMRLSVLSVGLWPMAHPSGAVAEVLELPEFEALRVDFWEELSACLLALFSGGHAPHVPHAALDLPWSI
jgi:AcrR family transcriptional regulator